MPPDLYHQALQLHQQGRLKEAADAYLQILKVEPGHVDAKHHLGIVAHQTGQHAVALLLISQAHQVAPTSATFGNLGEVLRALGRTDEALAHFDHAIRLNPKNIDAMTNAGRALMQKNRVADAVNLLDRAVAIDPRRAEVNLLLGKALRQAGSVQRAADAFKKATQLAPQSPEAYGLLAMALMELKRGDDALAAARRVVELSPQIADAHDLLGSILTMIGRPAEAVDAVQKAIAIRPTALFYGNLGWALHISGRHDEAVAALEQSKAMATPSAHLHGVLSQIHRARGDYSAALASAEESIRIEPSNAMARGHRAMARLLTGDLLAGFADYEWRWQAKTFTTQARTFPQPTWKGTDPTGRTVLLHAEQGFGDTFQFVRYATLLAERGAKVWVACEASAREVIASVSGVDRVVLNASPLLQFDLQSPMLSLPHAFRTTLETVPSVVPYITATPELVSKWGERMRRRDGRLRIGLCWAGSPGHANDAVRSVSLQQLAPLTSVDDVDYFSLQKGIAADQAKHPPDGMTIVDFSTDVRNFMDTAAIIANLDLVVSVDTSIVHLAGAMAKPVWTMVAFAPDWRWIVGRDDTPWYPTMRLFRQARAGDWTTVIRRVALELQRYRDTKR